MVTLCSIIKDHNHHHHYLSSSTIVMIHTVFLLIVVGIPWHISGVHWPSINSKLMQKFTFCFLLEGWCLINIFGPSGQRSFTNLGDWTQKNKDGRTLLILSANNSETVNILIHVSSNNLVELPILNNLMYYTCLFNNRF